MTYKHLFCEMDISWENIVTWAGEQAEKREPITSQDQRDHLIDQELRCVLGRWMWQHIDEMGSFDLKQSLHEFHMEGMGKDTPICELTREELRTRIMEDVVAEDENLTNMEQLLSQQPFFYEPE